MKKITKGWLKKRISNDLDEKVIKEFDKDSATPEEFLELIKEHPSKSRWVNCILMKADNQFAELLLEAGADPDSRESSELCPPLYYAVRDRRLNLIDLLIEYGADLNYQNNFGWTPLHIAAFKSHRDLVNLLIDEGARVELQDEKGNTPLNVAAGNDSPECMEELIDSGASVHSRGYMNLTPFLKSVYLTNYECAKVAIDAGGFVDVEDMIGRGWKTLCTDDELIRKIDKYIQEKKGK